jgi:hypothetical protein
MWLIDMSCNILESKFTPIIAVAGWDNDNSLFSYKVAQIYHIIFVKLKISDPEYLNVFLFLWGYPPPPL